MNNKDMSESNGNIKKIKIRERTETMQGEISLPPLDNNENNASQEYKELNENKKQNIEIENEDNIEENKELDDLEDENKENETEEEENEEEEKAEDENDNEESEKDETDENEDENEETNENSDKQNKPLNQRARLNPERNNKQSENPNISESNEKKENGMLNNLKNKLKPKNDKIDKAQDVVEKTKKAIKVTNKVSSVLFSILLNPITWAIVLVLILMTFASAGLSVMGQNDYNVLCDDMGVGSLMLDANADDFTRQSAIVSWLTSTPFDIMGGQPMTREQAIGIMGNLIKESYGANPKAIQGDHSKTQWEICDNNCVLGWGNAGGKAIGIIQWDTGRRIGLVNFAISEGTQWHDLSTQLKFLKKEIDSGYDSDQLVKGGFTDTSKSIAEYVSIWNVRFERSALAGTPAGDNPRIEAAEEFAQRYTGASGGSVGGGLSTNCIGGGMMGGIDTSNLVELAIASAWPAAQRNSSRGSCSGLVDCGQTFAMDAYKQAKLAAEAATSKDPIAGLLASCDRFVATMFRATGKDPSFPWGNTGTQGAYMKGSPDWEQVSCQDRQPGDVVWRNGHVMLYVGMVEGKDSIASASLGERTGAIGGLSCQGATFIGDGGPAIGYRKVR